MEQNAWYGCTVIITIDCEQHTGGYPTAIHAGFDFQTTVNLTKGLLKHETFDHTNGFTGTATVSEGLLLVSDEKATITTKIENDFTIVLSPSSIG